MKQYIKQLWMRDVKEPLQDFVIELWEFHQYNSIVLNCVESPIDLFKDIAYILYNNRIPNIEKPKDEQQKREIFEFVLDDYLTEIYDVCLQFAKDNPSIVKNDYKFLYHMQEYIFLSTEINYREYSDYQRTIHDADLEMETETEEEKKKEHKKHYHLTIYNVDNKMQIDEENEGPDESNYPEDKD